MPLSPPKMTALIGKKIMKRREFNERIMKKVMRLGGSMFTTTV
jgi:hypothetical protein